MIRTVAGSIVASLLLAAAWQGSAAAQAGIGVGQRDSHYRLGPGQYRHYKHYKPPRVHYPRRPEYADKPRQPQRPDVQQPTRGLRAPGYGAPPPAIERIPRL